MFVVELELESRQPGSRSGAGAVLGKCMAGVLRPVFNRADVAP